MVDRVQLRHRIGAARRVAELNLQNLNRNVVLDLADRQRLPAIRQRLNERTSAPDDVGRPAVVNSVGPAPSAPRAPVVFAVAGASPVPLALPPATRRRQPKPRIRPPSACRRRLNRQRPVAVSPSWSVTVNPITTGKILFRRANRRRHQRRRHRERVRTVRRNIQREHHVEAR